MINTRVAQLYSDYATVRTVGISFPNGGTELSLSIWSKLASSQCSHRDPLRLA